MKTLKKTVAAVLNLSKQLYARKKKVIPTLTELRKWSDKELRGLMNLSKRFCFTYNLKRKDLLDLAVSMNKAKID